MIAWTLVACGDGKSRWAGTITDYGITLNVACLEDIARSKRAADRPQDRQDVLIIEEMLRQREEWFVGLSRRTLRSFVPSAWTSDRGLSCLLPFSLWPCPSILGSMTDISPRLSAALADRYRIERELGAGGMATVHLP